MCLGLDVAIREFQETCIKCPIVPYTKMLLWHLNCYDEKVNRGGMEHAITIRAVFVLLLYISMNPETIEKMWNMGVGMIVVGGLILMMFGPLFGEFLDFMKDVKEWVKRS